MYCRYEEIENDRVLVIDEIERVLGKCSLYEFIDCVDDSKDCFEDNEYNYFYMYRKKLYSVLNLFSAKK